MVVELQKKNRNLILGVGVAVVALLFGGGTSGLYLVWKQHDLSSKTADLDDTAKKLQIRTEDLDQSVGKVASNVEKLSKTEEDDIFGRYAGAVYFVEIVVDKGTIVGTAFAIDKNGRLGTNAHITFPAAQALKAGRKVTVISHGGKKLYPVISAVSHSQYISWPGGKIQYQTPDVGVLTVRLPAGEHMPKFVGLASDEELRKLKPGAQLCYIGFPGWSQYDSLKRIEPHIYGGGLTRLMTLKEESGDFSSQYLLQHDMASMGGASGSLIFNRHGKVVAIHNSGREVSTSGPQGIVQGIPVRPKNGMRIDLLNDLLR
jgi:S1-C subfamily serine protease